MTKSQSSTKTLVQIVTKLMDGPNPPEFTVHGAAGLLLVHVAASGRDIHTRYSLLDDGSGYRKFDPSSLSREEIRAYAKELQVACVKRSVAALILGITETQFAAHLRVSRALQQPKE